MSIEQPDTPEPEKNKARQEALKTQLLAGDIDKEEFLESILEIDQKDPDHKEARKNLQILLDDEVQNLFVNHNLESKYQNLLSLSYFHVGQDIALESENYEAARSYFKNALSAAERGSSQEWRNYVRGTVAYFEKDTDKLNQRRAALESERNKQILKNLLSDLKDGGGLDYKSAYQGTN